VDDRREHFLGTLGDACEAARLAGLEVEVVTYGGGRVRGVPAVAFDGEVPAVLVVGRHPVPLDWVVGFTVFL